MLGPYTLTIHIADKGTPLLNPDDRTWDGEKTSRSGHMWYSIQDGNGNERSFGFAPAEEGKGIGSVAGAVTDRDNDIYYKPRHERTMEITEEQYNKLMAFGENGMNGKWGDMEIGRTMITGKMRTFDQTYFAPSNSCVDFTWAALKSAGLERQRTMMVEPWIEIIVPGKEAIPTGYDGEILPISNVSKVEQIIAPIPDSPHNSIHKGPSPKEAQAELRKKTQAEIFIEDPKKALALYPDDARINTASNTLGAVSDRFSGSKRGNAIVLKMQRNLAHRLEHDLPLPNPKQAFGMIANALERGGRGD